VCALVLVAALALSAAAPPNPCTNGSFEELAPNGFPLDWEPVGQTVEVVSDAHSGQRALRLVRGEDRLKAELRTEDRLKAGLQTAETGLNRAWKAKSGERGAMIGQLKGGIEFWYKALSAAEGTKLTVQAIPMNAVPIEGTDSPRATFTVPKEHVGDGQWHQGRLKYDFTGDPKARWVHFGARILGTAGEFLLDDFAYVERVGPLLRISRLRLDEDPKRPGERCTISALIENVGDAPAPDTRATLTAPPGLRASPAELRLGGLAPSGKANASWTVDGRREGRGRITLAATGGSTEAVESIPFAPECVIESWGPVTPVVLPGEPVTLECLVRNAGNAVLRVTHAEFGLFNKSKVLRPRSLLPGEAWVASATYAPTAKDWLSEGGRQVCGHVYIRADGYPWMSGCSVMRAAPIGVPPPSGRLRAFASDQYALLENEHLRLVFRRDPFEFAIGELSARGAGGWRTIAWVEHRRNLSRGHERLAVPPRAETADEARLFFSESAQWIADIFAEPAKQTMATIRVNSSFKLTTGSRAISVEHEIASEGADGLWLPCEEVTLYVLERDEAIFPGLEWLVGNEGSSSSLDIARTHPDRIRQLVHPNKVTVPAVGLHGRSGTVGLLWDPKRKRDGGFDIQSCLFASPDRFRNHRSHLAGLVFPTNPEFFRENISFSWKPSALKRKEPIQLRSLIFADCEAKDALAAVDEWIRIYGLPEPQPLPQRHDPADRSDQSDRADQGYEHEIQFSMQAYLKSLWVPETKEWWTSKGGGPIMSKKGRPHSFVADLLLGSLVSPDEAVRKACRERAEFISELINSEMRLDVMRFPGRFDLAIANPAHAAGLLATMGADGAWRFDADQEGKGPFVGMDYHDLGPDNAVEVGTCANKAFQVLRYARIAGDAAAYERMQKTLRLMETFRVPRAAQVWEVPVHTPDLLAAADAVDAYLEAYRFSGDERWLRDAVTWARRGIPFIYLWNPPDKPWLLGASIPVYGASWFTCSWFGRPVQWNGLRYATAILNLAPHDQSKDWRRLAQLIIHSAILQQDPDGENVALWPDNISAIDGKKCPWVFAPRQIIQNILLLNGRDEEPQTTILSRKPFLAAERRIHISATAKISDAAWDGDLLTFKAAYPPGEEGTVLISNVARPTAVLLDRKPLAERGEVERGAEPGWRYDEVLAYLSIRVGPPAAVESYGLKAALQTRAVRVEGARHRSVERLPTLAERLDFSFDRSAEGWMAAHDISDLAVRNGALCGKATGNDPYLVRSLVRVKGDDCPVLLIRMRATAGRNGQLFWTTEASPDFDEAKSLRFPLTADGRLHDYRLDLARNPHWAGETITALRLDPGDAPGEFAVDFIRRQRPKFLSSCPEQRRPGMRGLCPRTPRIYRLEATGSPGESPSAGFLHACRWPKAINPRGSGGLVPQARVHAAATASPRLPGELNSRTWDVPHP